MLIYISIRTSTPSVSAMSEFETEFMDSAQEHDLINSVTKDFSEDFLVLFRQLQQGPGKGSDPKFIKNSLKQGLKVLKEGLEILKVNR